MRSHFTVACGLTLLGVLSSTSPALAAGKRHKSKPVAPVADTSTAMTTSEDSAKADATPKDDVASKSDAASKGDASKPDEPPPAASAPSAPDSAPPNPQKSAKPSASLEHDVVLEPVSDEPRNADQAQLRREAARLASGRIEVAVSASAGIASRRFTYSDPVGQLLAPYRLPVAPMLSFGLEAYPLASTNLPVLRDLGFRGHVSRALAVDSKTPDGTTIDTSWTRFGGDVRYRVLVPGAHPLDFGFSMGLDASYFAMSTKQQVLALLPEARTIAARFGVDVRVLLAGRLSLLAGAGYLATTTRGEIYDHFRSPHVAGIAGDLGFAFAIAPGLEAELSGDYTRYFSTFHPKVGDEIVAGGALDQQMRIGLGVRYAH